MSSPLGAIGASIAATLGAAVGALGSAIIRARGHRPEAAGALVEAASQLTDRLLRRNQDLATENRDVRHALAALVDAGVVLSREHPHVSDATWEAWEAAQREAIRCL